MSHWKTLDAAVEDVLAVVDQQRAYADGPSPEAGDRLDVVSLLARMFGVHSHRFDQGLIEEIWDAQTLADTADAAADGSRDYWNERARASAIAFLAPVYTGFEGPIGAEHKRRTERASDAVHEMALGSFIARVIEGHAMSPTGKKVEDVPPLALFQARERFIGPIAAAVSEVWRVADH